MPPTATKLSITRPGGRWILIRGVISAPLAWAAMAMMPLFLAFDEASGRETFCRRCDEGTFAFWIDDDVLSGGNRALWIGAVLAVVVQGLLLQWRLRVAKSESSRKRKFTPRTTSHPAFLAAALALSVQTIAIVLALLVHDQPAHFYITIGITGYAIAMLPSFLAWFILPAFSEQPELDPTLMLEAEHA